MTRERVVIAPMGENESARAEISGRALARGFFDLLLPAGDSRPRGPSGRTFVRAADEIRSEGDGPRGGVPIEAVGNPTELQGALGRGYERGTIAIRWTGDRVLPLETVVAARRGRFELWVVTNRPAEVPAALGALEHGADRVFVEVGRPEEVDALERIVDPIGVGPLPWTLATIESIRPVGLGDRVIVDVTTLLGPDEGLLVGSSAAFLFHVASEAVGSTFTRPRRFRVNAGAAHSYTLLADGTTRYLSELEAGDAVCVATPNGPTRSARVGRLKIERRPLLLLKGRSFEQTRTLFVQEAETVRLSGSAGRVACTALLEGSEVYGVALAPARHLGSAVDESIEER
ncbi:MAG: 3-dehydroquinate synthase II [Thermoplasmata archaeon]|nr:3-dehydroquinate synthase II [Thermoplasmata archaeon]